MSIEHDNRPEQQIMRGDSSPQGLRFSPLDDVQGYRQATAAPRGTDVVAMGFPALSIGSAVQDLQSLGALWNGLDNNLPANTNTDATTT